MNRKSLLLFTGLIVLAAFSRLVPHPANFTPVGAIALFAGGAFAKRSVGLLVAALAMFVSDVFIGFHGTMWAVYLSFVAAALIGISLRKRLRPLPILGGAVASSIVFFLVTNFAVWLEGLIYPMNMQGLWSCYVAAIPFYRNALAGDLTFTFVLFGVGYMLLSPIKALPAHWVQQDNRF